ncbi:adenylylsulfate kinase [Arachidicoccus rhizosphaerae]|uniref:Adenylyl-sulfate kinase n=1 Tax=Arachidicoccus rhizosphaerae TaxID=551991 RepID=A0A1H3VM58_9BACT|nr:adenylyl-sulfate kinase [Arachidicoccus rhizosphaerae]SDZ75893.1 adenylylsulfate kinase [Arachidicoccus rhizosphaerae]
MIIQLCGLSGAGKTTLASKVQQLGGQANLNIVIIDGDQYRKTLCKDLGFSYADRSENLRRLTRLAHDYSRQGKIAIISAIHPFREIRRELKARYPGIKTVFIDCPVEVLVQRDTKGLYKRALLPQNHPDKLHNLTGLGDRFDAPEDPDLHLRTAQMSVDHAAGLLLDFIRRHIKK